MHAFATNNLVVVCTEANHRRLPLVLLSMMLMIMCGQYLLQFVFLFQVGELLCVYKVLQDGLCEAWRQDQVSGLVPINYLELLDE